jgi:hypothetical protein
MQFYPLGVVYNEHWSRYNGVTFKKLVSTAANPRLMCVSDGAIQVHMRGRQPASAALDSATPWVRILCVICIRAMQRSTELTSFPFEV